jgi:hypothetical protein
MITVCCNFCRFSANKKKQCYDNFFVAKNSSCSPPPPKKTPFFRQKFVGENVVEITTLLPKTITLREQFPVQFFS